MRYTLLFYLLTIPLFWTGCAKEPACPEVKLPPVTMDGRNTFGCKINGEPWVAYSDESTIVTFFGHNKLDVVAQEADSSFTIFARRFIQTDCELTREIFILNFKVGREKWPHLRVFSNYIHPEGCITSYVDTSRENSIKVHHWLRGQAIGQVAGTFSFTIYHPDCGDTLRVTDGRFDVSYH